MWKLMLRVVDWFAFITQRVLELRSEQRRGLFSTTALHAFAAPQLLLIPYIIYCTLTVCLVLLGMGALRADCERGEIGRRKWHPALSCQELVNPDTCAEEEQGHQEPVARGGQICISWPGSDVLWVFIFCVITLKVKHSGGHQGRGTASLLLTALEVLALSQPPDGARQNSSWI